MILFSFLAMASCAKSRDGVQPSFNQQVTWMIGAESSVDTTVHTSTVQSETGQLVIDNYSICPTHQLQVILSGMDEKVFFEAQIDTTTVEMLRIPRGQRIKIRSYLEPTKRDIQCVWLGQARLHFHYVQ